MRNQTGNQRNSKPWEDKWSVPGFDSWWQTDAVPKEFLAALHDYAPNPDARILDAGCGEGHLTCLISLMYNGTIGVDVASTAIARANVNAASLGAPAKFEVADVSKGEFPAGTFDVILDRGCLHGMNASDAMRSTQNIGRRLRPGGHFFQMHLLDARGTYITEKYLRGLGPEFRVKRSEATALYTRNQKLVVGYFVYSKKAHLGNSPSEKSR